MEENWEVDGRVILELVCLDCVILLDPDLAPPPALDYAVKIVVSVQ